jgi:hypothetical protein
MAKHIYNPPFLKLSSPSIKPVPPENLPSHSENYPSRSDNLPSHFHIGGNGKVMIEGIFRIESMD